LEIEANHTAIHNIEKVYEIKSEVEQDPPTESNNKSSDPASDTQQLPAPDNKQPPAADTQQPRKRKKCRNQKL
jgi:hypothetical protein